MSKIVDAEEVYRIDKKELEDSTIRKLEFIEKESNLTSVTAVAEDPEFLEQLKSDIQEILEKHKLLEPRLTNPQALIVVRTKIQAMEIAASFGNTGTFIVSGKIGIKNLKEFTDGEKQVATFCGMLREGYDNPNVTLCVFLINCRSRVFFEQFCGRAVRMNRNLTGKWVDKTVGAILSYPIFGQRSMWESREFISEVEPVEEEGVEVEVDENP